MFQPKYWNVMKKKTKVKRTYRLVYEQYRKTNQRKVNVRKRLFKTYEISAGEISFQIMRFCFSILNTFAVDTEEYYPKY